MCRRRAQPQRADSYTLPNGGRVSVAVYDADGRMVRELTRAEPQQKGRHTLFWDGLDQAGRALPRGKYHWRLLRTQGLRAKYLFSLGASFGDLPWPGQHGGPAAVAVAGEAIYMAAAAAEGTPQAVRISSAGVYQRAYASPEAGAMSAPSPWAAAISICSVPTAGWYTHSTRKAVSPGAR